MSGSINDFKSSFKTDIARPNRFDVTIPIPLSLITYVSDGRNLSFRCDTAQLPGRSFETTERKLGSAPTEKFPYHTNYQESTLTFILSDDMNEKLFFDAWLELMNPTSNFNFQYKSNYSTDISINQYDVSGQLTYSVVLQEAFPIDMNQLDMDWSADGHHKLAVVFCYKQWKNNSLQALGSNILNAGISGLISGL